MLLLWHVSLECNQTSAICHNVILILIIFADVEKKGSEIGELLKGRRCKRCWIRKSAKINMQSEQKQKEGRKLCPVEKSWRSIRFGQESCSKVTALPQSECTAHGICGVMRSNQMQCVEMQPEIKWRGELWTQDTSKQGREGLAKCKSETTPAAENNVLLKTGHHKGKYSSSNAFKK